jgi:hypothetical protein
MDLCVFRGKGRVFEFTTDNTGGNLPTEYGPWVQFKTLAMSSGEEPRAVVRTDECLDDIDNCGFHITDAHVRITDDVIKKG